MTIAKPGRPAHAVRWAVISSFLILAAATPDLQGQPTDVASYLTEIHALTIEAREFSRQAEQASTVADVKRHADDVFQRMWGISSGLLEEDSFGSEAAHGWKTAWQVTGAEFDSAFAARYGTRPPAIDDPRALGVIGRGRHVRTLLEEIAAGGDAPPEAGMHATHVIASLNNAIGWMKMDDGVTKGERQPRVDLMREWDSPIEFWLSTADTGWLFEVYSQATNILKTDYDGNVAEAREHAAGMTMLIEKALQGIDADGDGSIAPEKMEGGIETALEHARLGRLMD